MYACLDEHYLIGQHSRLHCVAEKVELVSAFLLDCPPFVWFGFFFFFRIPLQWAPHCIASWNEWWVCVICCRAIVGQFSNHSYELLYFVFNSVWSMGEPILCIVFLECDGNQMSHKLSLICICQASVRLCLYGPGFSSTDTHILPEYC